MKQFNKTIAQEHLNQMLTEHQINVVKWSTTSCGLAWIDKRDVKIPKPTNIDRFCLSMHELGHIIEKAGRKYMHAYEAEYYAEIFAFKQAENLGFDYTNYKERARRYVIMTIAKGYCRGLNIDNINQEIKDFCNIDFNLWKGNKVFIRNWGHKNQNLDKPLEIIYTKK